MRHTPLPIDMDALPAVVIDAPGTVTALVGDATSKAADLVPDLDPSVVVEPVVAFVDDAATRTAAVGREAAAGARRRPLVTAALLGAAVALVTVLWWRRRSRTAAEAPQRPPDHVA